MCRLLFSFVVVVVVVACTHTWSPLKQNNHKQSTTTQNDGREWNVSILLSTSTRFIRQLVIGWISVLDAVPDLNMLEHLPEFLGGLFSMLSDGQKGIDARVCTQCVCVCMC